MKKKFNVWCKVSSRAALTRLTEWWKAIVNENTAPMKLLKLTIIKTMNNEKET